MGPSTPHSPPAANQPSNSHRTSANPLPAFTRPIAYRINHRLCLWHWSNRPTNSEICIIFHNCIVIVRLTDAWNKRQSQPIWQIDCQSKCLNAYLAPSVGECLCTKSIHASVILTRCLSLQTIKIYCNFQNNCLTHASGNVERTHRIKTHQLNANFRCDSGKCCPFIEPRLFVCHYGKMTENQNKYSLHF